MRKGFTTDFAELWAEVRSGGRFERKGKVNKKREGKTKGQSIYEVSVL